MWQVGLRRFNHGFKSNTHVNRAVVESIAPVAVVCTFFGVLKSLFEKINSAGTGFV
jgi:hypothetical protein